MPFEVKSTAGGFNDAGIFRLAILARSENGVLCLLRCQRPARATRAGVRSRASQWLASARPHPCTPLSGSSARLRFSRRTDQSTGMTSQRRLTLKSRHPVLVTRLDGGLVGDLLAQVAAGQFD